MHEPIDRRVMLGAAGLLGAAALSRVASAGPLNPPAGPVTSTGKTLTEVEPRIAINAVNTPGTSSAVYRITQPGSYYLTGNVMGESGKTGIQIAASNVTVDLMGFAVMGVPGSLHGVGSSGVLDNLTVRNGAVSNWGSAGIRFTVSGIGYGALVESVHAWGNGSYGIRCSTSAVITNCTASGNGEFGISCNANGVISACASSGNTLAGIVTGAGGVVSDCCSSDNGGAGVNVGTSSTVVRCVCANNVEGVITGSASLVADCVCSSNQSHGIQVNQDCHVRGSLCNGNGTAGTGSGIIATSSDNRIEDNHCTNNRVGISAGTSGSFIARNTVGGNTTSNWSVAAANVCHVLLANFSDAFSGNSGGSDIGSSDVNTNYTLELA